MLVSSYRARAQVEAMDTEQFGGGSQLFLLLRCRFCMEFDRRGCQ